MKANELNVSVEVWLDHAPDSLNRTVVWFGDFVIWPTRGAENICAGQRLGISIPSGTLDGTVVSVREVPADGISLAFPYLAIELVDGQWDGLANGLMNGFFACGNWKVADGSGVVWDSSALPQGLEVAYADYELVRCATEEGEGHSTAMRAVFEAAAAVEFGPGWAEVENVVLHIGHEAVMSVMPPGITDLQEEPLPAAVVDRLQAMKMGLEVDENEEEELY